MKTAHIILIFLLFLIAGTLTAQQGINYKAIINDINGDPLANTAATVQFTILENGTTSVFQETHSLTTDANGIIIVNIGEGIPLNGDFNTIDWGSNPHFLKTEIDSGDGLKDMGTTEFKAVPYALHSETVTNVDDADPDPANELISEATLNGNILEISDAGGIKNVDLSSFSSLWNENGPDIYFNNGNVGIGTSVPDYNLEVVVDQGIATIAATTYRTSLFNAGQFIGEAARGTQAAPEAVLAEDFLASFNGRGYGATGFSDRPRGRFGVVAAENWNDENQGAYLTFWTTSIGTNEATEKMRISPEGNVGIGTSVPNYKLDVAGDINFTGLLFKNGIPVNFGEYVRSSADNTFTGNNTFIGNSSFTGDISVPEPSDPGDAANKVYVDAQIAQLQSIIDALTVGLTLCNGAYVNLQTDDNNCGECGESCPVGYICVAGQCINVSPDNDNDGWTIAQGDCDDNDPDNYPGNTEICDGKDNDCNGGPDYPGEIIDDDMDGFLACVDCDDNDAAINPGANEIWCNGIDNNCNGMEDESSTSIVDNNYGDCGSAPEIGSVCGDETWVSVPTYSRRGEDWVAVFLEECDGTIGDPHNLYFEAELYSPPDVDYDLYLYSSCGVLVDQSCNEGDNGHYEQVTHWINDNASIINPTDESQYVILEIRWHSGASCENWTLDAGGGYY